jgi:ferrous-iron efflux pump FieF
MSASTTPSLFRNPLWVSGVTILLVGLLVVLKTTAYVQSQSSSVLSSLIDSLGDIGISLMSFVAIRWSLKPADESHRHGHGKIEGVSALLQAAFLVGGASFLVLESFQRFLKPVNLTDRSSVLILMFLSLGISILISWLQKKGAAQSGSLALEADRAHYTSDMWINLAVIFVITLDFVGQSPTWLDPAVACAVACLLMRAAYSIALKALDMLMDRELSETTREKIKSIILAHSSCKGFHDLRTYKSGMKIFISFDLELDENLSLKMAHEMSREIEQALLQEFPHAEILIHLDPEGDTHDPRHPAYDRGVPL